MKGLLFAVLVLTMLLTTAQIPQSFNYQAIARTANNNVIPNQAISVQISIRDSSTSNTVYQEIDTATTNQFGLFTVAIGNGLLSSGNFATINWATGNKYLHIGFNQNGGLSNFVDMGTNELLSVPYALYAQTAGNAGGSFNHYIGELYGGGIVVSVWKISGVEHGLIASLTDLSDSTVWSNVTGSLIGTAAESPRNGQANTTAIIAQSGQTSSAALLCHNYAGGGYTDWYLPSMWELNQCYNAALIVNEVLGDANGFQFFTPEAVYWSSTECSANSSAYILAWGIRFGNGTEWYDASFGTGYAYGFSKGNFYSVRAVRKY